jgi:hypothetical protein
VEEQEGKEMSFVIGIDPGLTGAIVVTDGKKLRYYLLPVEQEGKDKRISFVGVTGILKELQPGLPIFLERAVSFGMGTKAAFNYGRGFEALCLAIQVTGFPLTMVEPAKWTKVMHQGISDDIKPKAKSVVAVKRLFPKLWQSLPQKPRGGPLDGPMDALLIAGYGLQLLNGGTIKRGGPDDFY